MKLTFWAVGCPFLIGVAMLAWHGGSLSYLSHSRFAGLFAWWFWVGVPLTLIYWLVRLVRYAWRDGTPAAPARPKGWIYPDEH